MGIWDEEAGTHSMIQGGVIDLYFEEEGQLILVDYKTDFVKNVDESTLVDRYKSQMSYYKNALEQSTKMKVKEIYLYSVGLQRPIKVDMMDES